MLFLQAIQWILTPANWQTVNFGPGIGGELVAHLWLTFLSTLVAAVIAVPIGLAIGHTGRGRGGAILIGNVVRAFPTLGLLSILLLVLGLGLPPVVLVFVLLGIPPLLAGAYAGVESVDKQAIDGARAVGMSEWQVLTKVEVPLALPLLLGGLRSAVLQIIATVTLVSNYGSDSLGQFIISGAATKDYVQMTAGAILVTVLALLADAVLASAQRITTPRGVLRGAGSRTTARGRRPLTAPSGAPISEGS
ncbi:ABC transporter permease subunit [Amnibacterium sp. CER49]|uniref:ABC transporter permease n=1 Tax=Amnibacterium sp. CER49 TaxID=3039161 RepID=UPI002447221E|nr:ABC transporter permease subunit [Amnibacterium sp. CER49]MDH2442465.1 ABC transporter permease subunit [Amnibacterium sp. CER49]